jgi:phosphatidylserine/phosphatidylglycerophosphate/cardiolipin synthase-like enzyme
MRFQLLSVFVLTNLLSTLVAAGASARERVAFVTTPEQAFAVRSALISDERDEIMADLNIVETDGRAGLILSALCAKASEGVRVRIVTDGLAAHFWETGGLTTESSRALNKRCGSNFEIRFWNPVEMNSPLDYLKSRKLRRDHDKILVFRGQNIVYTGDRNSQTVNYRDVNGYSYLSIDGVAEGRAASEAASYFESVWRLTGPLSRVARDVVSSEKNGERAFDLPFVGEEETSERRSIPPSTLIGGNRNGSAAAANAPALAIAPDSIRASQALSWIDTSVRFVHFDPRERLTAKPRFNDAAGFNRTLVSLVESARHELVISTPFLRLSNELYRAIKARKRAGVAVTLVTSRFDSKIIPKIQTQNRDIKRLTKLGVTIDQKVSTDDLHAKLIIADGERAYLGSHNLNMRGTFMDLEAGLLIDNPEAAQVIRAFALDTLSPYIKRRTDLKTTLIEGALKVCSYCRKQF